MGTSFPHRVYSYSFRDNDPHGWFGILWIYLSNSVGWRGIEAVVYEFGITARNKHGFSIISATAQFSAPDAFFGSVTTGISRWGIPL